ncbi:helix-turn-helix domain-containing protein [Hoyosella altamirensis]|uniref:DNA-binding transcriptional ArsR family regulator n=1 Tax=Hoyosella altamirensis TaxID=616997 RepID=A0A839RPY4_9ACTN|nr:helix-turn-helix domain-containing protein [Hoyosella altamirensis]MBB3038174.1 DNA-binding transcriptional ArsR family regulator [Hoyosella altamirensis]
MVPSDAHSFESRMHDLERRVTLLEQRGTQGSSPTAPHAGSAADFWVLDGLRQRQGEGVIYAGAVETGAGPVEWQYAHTADQVLDLDPGQTDAVAERLAALGSPVRLRLLLAVLRGASSVNELAALESMGTTGQIYHHIRILTAAGWLRSAGRGVMHVPPERVVPLLLAFAATF